MIDRSVEEAPEHHADRGWAWQEGRLCPLLVEPTRSASGRLSDSLLVAFEGLTTTVQPVATVLAGPVQDQAAL
jgi:hypothetical protein